MKEFLLILFFSKVINLTAQSTAIDHKLSLNASPPISAITPGALLEIDVSRAFKWRQDEDIMEYRKRIRSAIPSGSIKATLRNEKGNVATLVFRGSTSFDRESTYLLLDSDVGIPIGVEFSHVEISSETMLKDVNVIWKNYSK